MPLRIFFSFISRVCRNHNYTKSMRCSKKYPKREFHISIGLPQKKKKKERKKKSQIKTLTYHLKELEKEEQTQPNVSRRKEIIKIREEINGH